MLKGIAQAGTNDVVEERQGIVVALSQLSKSINGADTESSYKIAADTAATLIRVHKAILFINENNTLKIIATNGEGISDPLAKAARELAESSLTSSGPIVYSNISYNNCKAHESLCNAQIVSAICVPMRVGEANVGAMVLLSDVPRTFSPSDIELLHVIASQTALAAWRAKLQNEANKLSPTQNDELIRLAHRKIQELSLVNQVSEAVSSTLELDELLNIALEQSIMAVGAEVGSLMLVNEETGFLEIVASKGITQVIVSKTSQQIGDGIAGWVAKNGESVLVANAREDRRFKMEFYRDDITSAACVPLKFKGKVIGVLNVSTRTGRVFDERDLALLGTVANEMAVAIENARLYARVNRRTNQLDTLLKIGQTITSTLNLDEVLHRLCDQTCKLLQMDISVILLVDELSNRFRFGHGHGLKSRKKYSYFDLAVPIASKVIKTGKKLIVDNISKKRLLKSDVSTYEGIKTAVGFPLKNQGKIVGVLTAFAREEKLFYKSQRDIMGPLGELSGVAINNARIYRQKYKIATMLQQHLIPTDIPEINGLDIGRKFLPAREVGGDYYDFLDPSEEKVGIVMADVSGSDVEAAEYTTLGKHVLKAYAKEYESPSVVLNKTNTLISEETHAEMFISLFYGVLDIKNRILKYSCAGCEPPLLYRSKSNNIFSITASGILLGVCSSAEYEEKELHLDKGDILVLFTDGLTEAGSDDNRFGSAAVMDIVVKNSKLSAQLITDKIHASLLDFVKGRIADDVAIVVIKIK
ncbi:MAG: GAF domain-containing protein [Armatimonadota bacterium]